MVIVECRLETAEMLLDLESGVLNVLVRIELGTN